MKLKCYSVRCALGDGFERDVRVMASDEEAAKRAAENSFREGSGIEGAVALAVEETDSI